MNELILSGHPNSPYANGDMKFNILAPARPGNRDFQNTPKLIEFSRTRRVKITFEEHFYVQNARHLYYAVKELTVEAM